MNEKLYNKMEEQPDLWALATFIPNKREPVYNWFYYKEGFAKELVFKLIDHFSIEKGQTVLDPFCGSGTTLLACKQRGVNAMGFDVLPAAVFASKVKTADYDLDKLKDSAKNLLKQKFEKISAIFPPVMNKAFSRYALDDIAFFMKHIYEINDEKIKNFFLLALLNASLKVSYARKDGAVIKFQKRHVAPLSVMFRRTAYSMIKDLQHFSYEKCSTAVKEGDARHLPLQDESIDAVITSPPYLNNIDYQKVYEIENFILGGAAAPALRSFISDSEYFKDMELVLKELYRVCAHSAKLAIVVGNGFTKEIVESDMILSDMAEKIGFKINKIIVMNKRFALKDRTKKIGKIRESMILMEKD